MGRLAVVAWRGWKYNLTVTIWTTTSVSPVLVGTAVSDQTLNTKHASLLLIAWVTFLATCNKETIFMYFSFSVFFNSKALIEVTYFKHISEMYDAMMIERLRVEIR